MLNIKEMKIKYMPINPSYSGGDAQEDGCLRQKISETPKMMYLL
jgi:hypothetical protein